MSSRNVPIVLSVSLLALPLGPVGAQEAAVTPPVAKVVPHQMEEHGNVRVDDYYWLKERENPEVIAYLEAENAYTEAVMAHTEALQETLFQEIRGRIKQTDASVPYFLEGYFYYRRYEDGKEYPIYCRKPGSLEAHEQVILDVNALAAGHDFFAVQSVEVSHGRQILAYAADTVGRRIYTIRFKDLRTGEHLADEISAATANLEWANDDRTLFYTKQDPETLRWDRVLRHTLGTDPSEDVLVYHEADSTFWARVGRTKSRQYVMIASEHTLSSEYRFVDAFQPHGEFTVFHPRERGLEYAVDHYRDHFYVRTNLDARNFRLMRTPVNATAKEHWEEVIPHREEVLLRGFEIFKDHLVVAERSEGLVQLRIMPWDGSGEHYLEFGEPAYDAWITGAVDRLNPTLDTKLLRYGYTSMTTPNSWYDYDMETRDKVLLKRDEVLGDFDPSDYRTERLWAPATDGVRVPISVVYRADTPLDGSAPLLVYGYGSYGYSMDASFSASRLSLLDRGFVYAIAHVRGGQEMGRWWYEDGKLLKKKNTFTDFIAVAEHLVAERYADPGLVFAMGGSAGGLLMGAVTNMRPDLWNGVVAEVPFVDVITTMLDDSIPLTTGEFDEWGNPDEEEFYDYMLSYSPYDQVEAKEYPNLLVTTGLHDSQVQYWEPAKWVAKLRATKTDDNLLLLKTNMEAGHGGASGRYRRYREIAFVYAFLLDLAGVAEPALDVASR